MSLLLRQFLAMFTGMRGEQSKAMLKDFLEERWFL